MVADSKLEESIDKILSQSQTELLSSLQQSRDEALDTLSKSQSSLEQEYDRIIDEKKKQKKLKNKLSEAQI